MGMGVRIQRAWDLFNADRTYRQIAEELGCALESVGPMLTKARKYLRGEIKPPGRPPKTSAMLEAYPDVQDLPGSDGIDYSHMGPPPCSRCHLRDEPGKHVCQVQTPNLYQTESSIAGLEDLAPEPDYTSRVKNHGKRGPGQTGARK